MALVNQVAHSEATEPHWNGLYKIGGAAALVAVAAALLDIGIMFLPGTGVTPGALTVVDWFTAFRDNWFLGLRNLGLLNMVTTGVSVPMFLALYAAHRRENPGYAALAAILLCMGTTIYIANNQALPMLTLSGQYAAATSETQRSLLVAAGQALLAHEDLTPGAFPGFLFAEVAGIIMCVVMLRGSVFGKATALLGILGEGALLIFNILAAFVPALFTVAMILAMIGGLSSLAWLILIARRLFQLARPAAATLAQGAPSVAAA